MRLIQLFFLVTICLCFLGGCKGTSGKESGQITEQMDLYAVIKEQWKKEIPILLTYCRNHEMAEVFETDDAEIISRLTDALSNIKILEETDESATDSDDILVFQMKDGREYSICFESGRLLQNQKRYIVDGFKDVELVLREIMEK